jgi:hypothetical protein
LPNIAVISNGAAEVKPLETNPVLNAVTLQQIDMLRYLLNTYHIPVRESTKDPGCEFTNYYTVNEVRSNAEKECYGLKHSIRMKQLEVFKILWEEHYNAWDYLHLDIIIDYLKENKDFNQGISFFSESYATDIILNSLTPAAFKVAIKKLLKLVEGTSSVDYVKRLETDH